MFIELQTYKSNNITAVDAVSVCIPKGLCFGLLGVNGKYLVFLQYCNMNVSVFVPVVLQELWYLNGPAFWRQFYKKVLICIPRHTKLKAKIESCTEIRGKDL